MAGALAAVEKAETQVREFDLLAEGLQCKTRLQSFTADLIERLGVSSQDMVAMVRADSARRNNNVYFHFPFCFAQAFDVDIQLLRDLSYCGILWLSYARFQDDVIDGTASPSGIHILFKDLYLIESLQQMHKIFPPSSRYWTYFAEYYNEFVNAIVVEKRRVAHPSPDYTDDEYRTVARGKAAMAKCAVAALGVLSEREDRITALARSIDCYHVAYQRYDDLLDWKADLRTAACTQLLHSLAGSMHADQHSLPLDDKMDRMAHILHYCGVADRHLAEAQQFCEEALDLSSMMASRIWSGNVQRLHTLAAALQTDLRVIAQKNILDSEWDISPHPMIAIRRRGSGRRDGERLASEAGEAADRGLQYIRDRQREDGMWDDFLHGGTRSVDWTTGYVGMLLKHCSGDRAYLDKAADALLARQHPDGGWGWSLDITPVDADSTSCALAFLNGNPQFEDTARSPAISAIRRFYHAAKGGYSTYTDDAGLRQFLGRNHPRSASVRGWCSPQVCVTGLALEAQIESGSISQEELSRSVGFLRSAQRPEGFWDAYWWDSAYYSTFHCLRVFHLLDLPEDQECVLRAVQWIASSQASDGSWGMDSQGRNLPFHTALAVSSLLLNPVGQRETNAVERGIQWLLEHQLADGAWPHSRILRIPRPDSLAPWNRGEWKESPTDLNVLLRDQRALFTTTTSISALARYQRSVRQETNLA